MIVFDTPRPVNFRRFKATAHCASTLTGEEATAELLAFARRIGLQDRWIQHRGRDREHFDLFDGKIDAARRAGAVEITSREFLARCVFPKREAGQGR